MGHKTMHAGKNSALSIRMRIVKITGLVVCLIVPSLATAAMIAPRQPDGAGGIEITGDRKPWHKLTLTLDGPFARELDDAPNPFTDCRMAVRFTHESGEPDYVVPGYFAADGNAADSSAECGTKWRAHLSPDKPGKWSYMVSFRRGEGAALALEDAGNPVAPYDGAMGEFVITAPGTSGPRTRGRLTYVGKHHLQFAGDRSFFLKAGADAPETLLAYADFDGTEAKKKNVPLKTWKPHLRDWKPGDPSWQGGKGKGLIGALNYLASKGMNAFSFIPYNAGGDGDNVWPFVSRDRKLHYDCSKLDQWGIVFDHATARGLYLHFKLQETEMDRALDGGKLGPERKLYCRELVARFGHALALNWNIGEENKQSTVEVLDMVRYLRSIDPYRHHVVIHTFPNQQEKVYRPLLGKETGLTGTSLQNDWKQVHPLTAKWIRESARAGHPWVVTNDEQGPADLGVPPDPDYPGKAKAPYSIDDIRKFTLWGNLMAGGAGVEYYFGYQLAQNDLLCEDWRSRDASWDYARIALDFFRDHEIPFQDMACSDERVGNPRHDNSAYCLAKGNEVILVYLPEGGECELDLPATANLKLAWFNPRNGELGPARPLASPRLKAPDQHDWLALIR
jgi:hypothetical protein